MGGPDSSRKWALKRSLPALIKAKDILKLHEQGESIGAEMFNLCTKAVEAPSLLPRFEGNKIYREWVNWAKTGKLRGIRSTHK